MIQRPALDRLACNVMGPTAIRAGLRRRRHHVAVAGAVLAVAGLLAVHHAGFMSGDMGEMHHYGLSATVQMCVGTFAAVGAAVVAVAFGLVRLGRWPWQLPSLPHRWAVTVADVQPRARAGPALLPLICVWRR